MNKPLDRKPFHCFSPVLPVALALALPVSMAIQSAAQALTFRFEFDGLPEGFQTAAQEAAGLWSAVLKDDVVVDLRVEYSDLSAVGSVLGGTLPGRVKVKYEDYVEALLVDSISSNDYLALSNLPLSDKGYDVVQSFQTGSLNTKKAKLDSKEFSFLMDGQFAGNRGGTADFIDGNGNNNNRHIMLTNAQARALGLADPYKSGLDGVIRLNSSVDWDAERQNGVDPDKYDLSTVLQHEIGHALGFISGSDSLDSLLASASGPIDAENNKFSYLTPLDFYRYSAESAKLGVSDLTLGGNEKYFSLDGGDTAVTDQSGRRALFSTGSLSSGGDGYQGSHWKANGNPLGIMNPVLSKGESINISELDLKLLDSIGWNLTDNNAERSAAIGLNWSALTEDLERDRNSVKNAIVAQWRDDIPALEAALSEASFESEGKFREKFQEEFEKLFKKLEGERDSKKREKEIDKFYEKVDKEAEKRNDELRKLPEKIYKIDEEVREWLSLPADKLSEKIEKADGATMNRLANVVKAAPAEEKAVLEPKLESAIAQFSEQPNKVLEQLLDEGGPVNPVSWAAAFRLWWWGMEAADEADSVLYAATAAEADTLLSTLSTTPLADETSVIFNSTIRSTVRSSDAEDVPEPSSVLALFGIACLGARLLGNRRLPE